MTTPFAFIFDAELNICSFYIASLLIAHVIFSLKKICYIHYIVLLVNYGHCHVMNFTINILQYVINLIYWVTH